MANMKIRKNCNADKVAKVYMKSLAYLPTDERNTYLNRLEPYVVSGCCSHLGIKNRKNVTRELVVECIEKYGYVTMPLRQLIEESKNIDVRWGYSSTFICSSCAMGTSSTTVEEVEEQRAKYGGEFICKNCENRAINAGMPGADFRDTLGQKLMLTKKGFYYDQGVSSDKGRGLGFGGSWWLIHDLRKDSWHITNNLFESSRLHSKLFNLFDYNITHEIFGIYELQQALALLPKEKLRTLSGWGIYVKDRQIDMSPKAEN